jgi:ParB-like nuclease domain
MSMQDLVEEIMSDKRPEQSELLTVPLRQVFANPFRNLDRYPIRRDKVTALRESIRATGFWGNIVARPCKGGVEIAYGHHRKVALVEELGEDAAIGLLVRPLDDDVMLKIMARENMQDWGTSAEVEQETIRAVVRAYAEGRITLPPLSPSVPKNAIRYAPSFLSEVMGTHHDLSKPYTGPVLAAYVGWDLKKVINALTALQYVEEGILTDDLARDLNTTQAQAAITEARRAREARETQAREAEKAAAAAAERAKQATDEATRRQAQKQEQHARKQAADHRAKGKTAAGKVARGLTDKMRAGKMGYSQAREEARKLDSDRPDRDQPPPHIDKFARKLADELNAVLAGDDLGERLSELVRWREHLDLHEAEQLSITLQKLSERCLGFADAITSTMPAKPVQPRRIGMSG